MREFAEGERRKEPRYQAPNSLHGSGRGAIQLLLVLSQNLKSMGGPGHQRYVHAKCSWNVSRGPFSFFEGTGFMGQTLVLSSLAASVGGAGALRIRGNREVVESP